MKITKSQLKQIIKEEISNVISESDGGHYEYYLDHPREGIYSDSEQSLDDVAKEIKYALGSFYKGAKLVAIFDSQGSVVKLGEDYDEHTAQKIKQENQ